MKNLSKLTCFLLFGIVGCVPLSESVKADPLLLPPGATNVKTLNGRWVSFSLNDQTFYLGRHGAGDATTLVFIPLPKTSDVPSNFKCPSCGANIVITEMGAVQLH